MNPTQDGDPGASLPEHAALAVLELNRALTGGGLPAIHRFERRAQQLHERLEVSDVTLPDGVRTAAQEACLSAADAVRACCSDRAETHLAALRVCRDALLLACDPAAHTFFGG